MKTEVASTHTADRLLLTRREAARALSISERTLWGMDVPTIRIGKAGVRYAMTDLKAWIDQQRQPIDKISKSR